MAKPQHYDVIWIGTGQATLTVVPRLAATGKSVAIIEGGMFGGTCVNHGCTPTKTLVASAYAVHLARRGADYGFSVNSLQVDFAKVMAMQQVNRQKSVVMHSGQSWKQFRRVVFPHPTVSELMPWITDGLKPLD